MAFGEPGFITTGTTKGTTNTTGAEPGRLGGGEAEVLSGLRPNQVLGEGNTRGRQGLAAAVSVVPFVVTVVMNPPATGGGEVAG